MHPSLFFFQLVHLNNRNILGYIYKTCFECGMFGIRRWWENKYIYYTYEAHLEGLKYFLVYFWKKI